MDSLSIEHPYTSPIPQGAIMKYWLVSVPYRTIHYFPMKTEGDEPPNPLSDPDFRHRINFPKAYSFEHLSGRHYSNEADVEERDEAQHKEDVKQVKKEQEIRQRPISESLDRLASKLEKKGLLKEAEMLDMVSNSLDKMSSELTDQDPRWLANKVSITYLDPDGRTIKTDEGRVYTDQKPSGVPSDMFVQGGDGRWYLQEPGEHDVFILSTGVPYLIDADTGKKISVRGLKVVDMKGSAESIAPYLERAVQKREEHRGPAQKTLRGMFT